MIWGGYGGQVKVKQQHKEQKEDKLLLKFQGRLDHGNTDKMHEDQYQRDVSETDRPGYNKT